MYWTKLRDSLNVPSRPNHPWAELVSKSLNTSEPELFQALEESGDLGAYIDVHVDDAIKAIRQLRASGTDYDTAKELVFADLFPVDPPEITEDDQEGGEQDAIDGLTDWLGV